MLGTRLLPQTSYVLGVDVPTTEHNQATHLTLSFTTGDGPTHDPVPTPRVRFQHFSGPADFPVICGPGASGSCLSFGAGVTLDAVALDDNGAELQRYLFLGAQFWSLAGDDGQGATAACFCARATKAAASARPVTLCGDQAESNVLPDVSGIHCDADGLTIDGVAVASNDTAAGGVAGSSDVSAAGGVAGSSDVSAAGGVAGSSDDAEMAGAGPTETRTILTKGCGCSLPGLGSSPHGRGVDRLRIGSIVAEETRSARRQPARVAPMTLRVVGAGLGRTGTHSLKLALERLLGAPCYHMMEVFKHPAHLERWTAAGHDEPVNWRALLHGFVATVDWPAAAYWKELSEAFPEAIIVLSTRPSADWWKSASETIFAGRSATSPAMKRCSRR